LKGEEPIKVDTMGGQAVVEGVLMRSPNGYAIAVRKKSGEIKVKTVPYKPITKKIKLFSLPFLRGAISLFEMLVIGVKALDFSVNEWEEGFKEEKDKKEEKEAGKETGKAKEESVKSNLDEKSIQLSEMPITSPQKSVTTPQSSIPSTEERTISLLSMILLIFLSFVLAMVLGVAIPNLVTSYLGRIPGIDKILGTQEVQQNIQFVTSEKSHLVEEKKPFVYNLVAGTIRALILFLYVIIISRLKDIQRIFEYHGAEHKSVFAFEKEGVATVENTKKYATLHPRCGTSFLAIVIFISIIVFACIAWLVNTIYPPFTSLHFALKKSILITLHILFAPIVAGISYEILKFSAKRQEKMFFRLLILPGLLFQKITTKEPDASQIEVAIVSLNEVLSIKPDEEKPQIKIVTG